MELAKAFNDSAINEMARVNFYNTYAEGRVFDPYDCGNQPTSKSGGNLTKYCLQSRFYSCATKIHCPITELGGECAPADQQKLASFFPCAENAGGGMSSFTDALPCAQKFSLNVDAIKKCYDPSNTAYDSEPVQVIDAVSNATESAKPKVQFFPDVRVGGKQVDPTAAALIKAICAAYTGTKPSSC